MSFGGGGFGSGGFGSAVPSLDIILAVPIAENVVRVTYSEPIYFSGLLDAKDGSDPSKYHVDPDTTTSGLDGTTARAVGVIGVALAPATAVGTLFGSVVDLTLDRSMTSWPAVYVVSSVGVWNAARTVVDPATMPFNGTHAVLSPSNVNSPRRRRDFANPKLFSDATLALSPANQVLSPTGTFVADSRGDYAYDEGLTGLKKRILRRLCTRPNAFAHLPGYGVGIPQQLKKLATGATIATLVAEAERQIAQEPDVDAVRVTATIDAANNLVRFLVLVKAAGNVPVRIDAPFKMAA